MKENEKKMKRKWQAGKYASMKLTMTAALERRTNRVETVLLKLTRESILKAYFPKLQSEVVRWRIETWWL